MNERPEPGFMREAIQLARHSVAEGGGPFGAVVVKAGRIIGRGHNRVTLDHDPTAHAEIEAIRAACAVLGEFRLDGCVLYSSCLPCPMCLSAAYWARVQAIVYGADGADAAAIGFDDAFILAQLMQPAAQRSLPMQQYLREDALQAFLDWQQRPDRVEY
jgi:tRNA(Arg) A34 adenosine deaminase TadA